MWQDETDGVIHSEGRNPATCKLATGWRYWDSPPRGDYTPLLENATYRKVGHVPAPEPDRINSDEALKGNHDCRLVRMEAVVAGPGTAQQRKPFSFCKPGTTASFFHALLEMAGRRHGF